MTASPDSSKKPAAWAVYFDPRVIRVLFLGYSSGLPLALVGATLGVWLAETGVTRASIGLFTLVLVPYTFKWAWAPFVDRLSIPFLTPWLGRRRSWLLVVQLVLATSIVVLGTSDPKEDLFRVALLALITCFCAATQDIVIDAWRIETLAPEQQGAGSAMAVAGYQLGRLGSGAGALYLATYLPWSATYTILALSLSIGLVAALTLREPADVPRKPIAPGFAAWLRSAVVEPFADFTTRDRWAAILLFILLYKLPDQLQGVMSSAFYIGSGFTKIEIANASKIFGVAATLIGVTIGGALTARYGSFRMLVACGITSALSVSLFALLSMRGHDLPLFYAAVGVENFSRGMGDAAFIAYLALLCNRAYTATQFALLSALAAFTRDLLVAPAGFLADALDWTAYFTVASVCGAPALLLLLWLKPQVRAVAR
ncbi:AmpG family muropeptide MFS transporter [Roseiterribacter gracilis]|uniref:MFS transporter n=1 Tax=Roseiterribacter gracilis TaxID=2812848 RepID=A0A8S8XDN3_9PROT|nr:MFS transporter [Rhodospirillales bacterium TMPK1]